MADAQKGEKVGEALLRRKSRNKLAASTVAGILFLVLVVSVVFGVKTYALEKQKTEYQAQYRELKEEQAELKENDEEIKEYEDYTKSKKYMENVARQKLGLAYPGEIVFEPDEE
ncbi:MAG: septum formation initiator family protein [Lachnospiraceae bacterium]|nr:septum formation initiator family protein [Lachnospiraceae bacterium]